MPIFEYECDGCGNRFEEFMRRSDPDPPCPHCSSGTVHRLISSTSFQLKGSGWYVTDYAGGATRPNKDGKDGKDKAEEGGKAADAGSKDNKETAKTESGTSPTKSDGDAVKTTKSSSANSTAEA